MEMGPGSWVGYSDWKDRMERWGLVLGLVTLTGRTGWRWGPVLGLVTRSDWKDRMERWGLVLGLVTGRTGWRDGAWCLGWLLEGQDGEMGPGAWVGYSDWKDRMEMGPGAWVGYWKDRMERWGLVLGLVTLTGRTGWRWGLVLGLVTGRTGWRDGAWCLGWLLEGQDGEMGPGAWVGYWKDRMEMGPGSWVGYWKDRMEMGPGAWVGYWKDRMEMVPGSWVGYWKDRMERWGLVLGLVTGRTGWRWGRVLVLVTGRTGWRWGLVLGLVVSWLGWLVLYHIFDILVMKMKQKQYPGYG